MNHRRVDTYAHFVVESHTESFSLVESTGLNPGRSQKKELLYTDEQPRFKWWPGCFIVTDED